MPVKGPRPRVWYAAVLVAGGGVAAGLLHGWPPWGIALAGVVPVAPVLALEAAWMHRGHRRLVLFALLLVAQGVHVVDGAVGRSIGGPPDDRSFLVVWAAAVGVTTAILLLSLRGNRWLWAAAGLAAAFVGAAAAGDPARLVSAAVMWMVLVIAFLHQVRRTHDEWLARALPRLGAEQLATIARRMETKRFRAGETICREGEAAQCFFVVVKGELEVVGAGSERVNVLGPGEFFGEIGLLMRSRRTATVRALTPVEVLVGDRGTFARLMHSSETVADIMSVAKRRGKRSDASLP